ncbi:MAG TPA: HEAT repeat domain-containing protein [Oculatellaceae cyanobacterium]
MPFFNRAHDIHKLTYNRDQKGLLLALGFQKNPIRVEAVEAIGKSWDWIDKDQTIPALAQTLLNDQNEGVRMSAAKALGRSQDVRAYDPLVKALDDIWLGVRDEALIALGKLKDPRAYGAGDAHPRYRGFDRRGDGAALAVGLARRETPALAHTDPDGAARHHLADSRGDVGRHRPEYERRPEKFWARDVLAG